MLSRSVQLFYSKLYTILQVSKFSVVSENLSAEITMQYWSDIFYLNQKDSRVHNQNTLFSYLCNLDYFIPLYKWRKTAFQDKCHNVVISEKSWFSRLLCFLYRYKMFLLNISFSILKMNSFNLFFLWPLYWNLFVLWDFYLILTWWDFYHQQVLLNSQTGSTNEQKR